MPDLRDRLTDLFKGGLRDGDADLETLTNDHVSGHVISSEFEGLDYEERRKRIRRLIDDAVAGGRLDRADALRVSTMLTYTPAEWAVATAGLTNE